jgi:nitrilase
MRVCVVQTSSIDDKKANLAAAGRLIGHAVAEDRPDLVLLPEVFAFQGGSPEARLAAAEPIPGGEAYAFLQEQATRHRIILHGGSYLERAGDRVFNTSVVFDRDGSELARYRKIHLFDVVTPDGREYRESATVGRGQEVATYEADGVRVGCSICYDLRFGELYRALAAAGAQLLVVPAAFTVPTGMAHWEVLLRARAIETGCYVAAAAQVGTYTAGKDQRACWGHSMLIDPWGKILAQVTDRPGFATARIDQGYLGRVREMIPVHRHRVLKG